MKEQYEYVVCVCVCVCVCGDQGQMKNSRDLTCCKDIDLTSASNSDYAMLTFEVI